MARSNWEADKMLDVYIYDYLVKRNLHNSAKAFMNEGKVATDPVAIDAPGGFLFEWWSIFWDIFDARTRDKPHEGGPGAAAAPSMDMKSREHQTRLQLLQQQNAHLQRRDPNNPALNGAMNSDVSAVLASKLMEGMRNHNPMDSEASQQLFDANNRWHREQHAAATGAGQLRAGVEEADGAVLVAGPGAAAGLHGDRGAAAVHVGGGQPAGQGGGGGQVEEKEIAGWGWALVTGWRNVYSTTCGCVWWSLWCMYCLL